MKAEIQQRHFEASIPAGYLTYPVSQAADIAAFKATAVPVGEDQLPMIEQTKEIIRRFNTIYGDTLSEPEALLPSNKACLRLPGIDGKAKMSKSLHNCIYLSDSAGKIEAKIMGMFTDPNHIRVCDPGRVEGNPVFTYLDAFCRDDHFTRLLPAYKNLDELKNHYRRGGLGDVKVKQLLNAILQEELAPIRDRRHEWEGRVEDIGDILLEGCKKAQETAASTLCQVKAAMQIDYFRNDSWIREQAAKFPQSKME